MQKRGFTLIELLTVVLVVAVLAAMAVPMYEKAIERSHMAEARNMLKLLLESKLRTLDTMGIDHYGSSNVTYTKERDLSACNDPFPPVWCLAHVGKLHVSQEHFSFSMHALDASLCCSTGEDLGSTKKHSCLTCADDERDMAHTNKQLGYTKSFEYSLNPKGSLPNESEDWQYAEGYSAATAIADAVCARRIGVGDLNGVQFLYLGSLLKKGAKLLCYDPNKNKTEVDRCKEYGMVSFEGGAAWCD